MCTYATEQTRLQGSGKGRDGWFTLTDAAVYIDHPYHTAAEHTLNIDFRDATGGAGARVAVELSVESARDLVACIERALQWNSSTSS